MPIRQTKAKLWFQTKEERDQYDDKMIASIQLKTNDFEDQNYSPVFMRAKKQFVLSLGQKPTQQALQYMTLSSGKSFLQKYYGGKNDHTHWRQWTFHKAGVSFAAGYLLLRELPIRNFYARSFIMLIFFSKIASTYGHAFSFVGKQNAVQDRWSWKDVKNYEAFQDSRFQIIPQNYNKLDEARLWKLSQPAYLRYSPERFPLTVPQAIFGGKTKKVAWDGTFNMPLEGLAHHLHKDAKYIDFIGR